MPLSQTGSAILLLRLREFGAAEHAVVAETYQTVELCDRNNETQRRLLLPAKRLHTPTAGDHSLSASDIPKVWDRYGVYASCKSVYSDTSILTKLDMDIICVKSAQNRSFYLKSPNETPGGRLVGKIWETRTILWGRITAITHMRHTQNRNPFIQKSMPARFSPYTAAIPVQGYCENSIMRSINDHFGEVFVTELADTEHFRAVADIVPSPPFFYICKSDLN